MHFSFSEPPRNPELDDSERGCQTVRRPEETDLWDEREARCHLQAMQDPCLFYSAEVPDDSLKKFSGERALRKTVRTGDRPRTREWVAGIYLDPTDPVSYRKWDSRGVLFFS